MEIWMIGHEGVQEEPSVDQITNIVVRRHATRAEKQLTRLVSNRERIDRDAREGIAGDSSDIDRPVHGSAKARLHDLPRHVGMHDHQAATHDHEAEECETAHTDDCDEPTSFHGSEIWRKCDTEDQPSHKGAWQTFGV